ncbi:hypothetical protein SeMB42_g02358, partial [Synchytrium endobioticum]
LQRRRRHARPPQWGTRSSDSLDVAAEAALERRRQVYRYKLRARHIRTSVHSKYKELCPDLFAGKPDRLNRLVPWIRRELKVLLRNDNVEMVKDYILAVIQKFDLQSDMAIALLSDFLFEDSELFIHELVAFATSPFDIEAYDAAVQYPPTAKAHHPTSHQTSLSSRAHSRASSGPSPNPADRCRPSDSARHYKDSRYIRSPKSHKRKVDHWCSEYDEPGRLLDKQETHHEKVNAADALPPNPYLVNVSQESKTDEPDRKPLSGTRASIALDIQSPTPMDAEDDDQPRSSSLEELIRQKLEREKASYENGRNSNQISSNPPPSSVADVMRRPTRLVANEKLLAKLQVELRANLMSKMQ